MSLKVRIRYFALYRDLSGKSEETLNVDEGTSVGNVLESVRDAHPIFRKQGGNVLLAVNEEYADPETVLMDGDEIAIFPNVSGG